MNIVDDLNKPMNIGGIVVGNFYNGAANIPDNYGSYLSIKLGDAAIQFAVGTQSVPYCNKRAYVRIKYGTIEGWHQLD